jgi:hypothetical protein
MLAISAYLGIPAGVLPLNILVNAASEPGFTLGCDTSSWLCIISKNVTVSQLVINMPPSSADIVQESTNPPTNLLSKSLAAVSPLSLMCKCHDIVSNKTDSSILCCTTVPAPTSLIILLSA